MTYYCFKCRRIHRMNSDTGESHMDHGYNIPQLEGEVI